jgi:hypothetical protein
MGSPLFVLGGYKGYGLSVLGGYKGYGLSILCFRWIQRL